MAVFELTAGQFALLSQVGTVTGPSLPVGSATALAVDVQLGKFRPAHRSAPATADRG